MPLDCGLSTGVVSGTRPSSRASPEPDFEPVPSAPLPPPPDPEQEPAQSPIPATEAEADAFWAALDHWRKTFGPTAPAALPEPASLARAWRIRLPATSGPATEIIDAGARLFMAPGHSRTPDAVRLMIEAAKARGWRTIYITGGDERFKQQIWREARRLGLPVANYIPPWTTDAPAPEFDRAIPAHRRSRCYDALKSVPAAPAAPDPPCSPQARPSWRNRLRFRARLLALFRGFARDLTTRATPPVPQATVPQARPRRRFRSRRLKL